MEENCPKQDEPYGIEEWVLFATNHLQNQFSYAETKATFLIAGNTLLLAVFSQLLPIIFTCDPKPFNFQCANFDLPLIVYIASGLFCLLSVMLAMFSVTVHRVIFLPKANPSVIFFPYIASRQREEYIAEVINEPARNITVQMLGNIHGMACKATSKYKWLAASIICGIISVSSFFVSIALVAHHRLCY